MVRWCRLPPELPKALPNRKPYQQTGKQMFDYSIHRCFERLKCDA